jgi:hypothetical protein
MVFSDSFAVFLVILLEIFNGSVILEDVTELANFS